MDTLSIAAVTFGLIFLFELPDKTFLATLVMATRFRPLYVWIGVTLAFFVQTLVAVAVGGLLARLPKTPIEIFSGVIFLVAGVLLVRSARGADEEGHETEEEFDEKAAKQHVSGWKVVPVAFTILFLAEWGDLSQILTANLTMKYGAPAPVFVGAFVALATVSALAALLGRVLLTRMKLSTLRLIGGVVCLIMAAWTGLQLAGVIGA